MLGYVFIPAILCGLVSLIGSWFPVNSENLRIDTKNHTTRAGNAITSGIVSFGLVSLFNWLILYYHMPPTINPSMWASSVQTIIAT